ncbi:phosphonate transport system substrate-binding protein [Desulfotomaculum arcticum]|uniref:Phosphonate transport system substrate-binding protein n=1 Tax=Desulfotruncus arcticus DSM 17038 TaxID=1121424 RepID=A0A1I2V6Q8_9FIRM|nr:PhnD/SsuA/transferrin family substrate-binding protein [Desulfotruncus arcticus]SFG83026.1 phosphonate transport system substrate-binding protein [Desulfotomaculum arcticum] [Desulfotruncus arcticus DSM 17038]
MKKIPVLSLVIVLVLSLLAGCGTTSATSAQDPDSITIAWLPNCAGDDFKEARAEIDRVIEKASGIKVVDKLTTDYAITIEAMASGNAQLAWVGAQQYIEAHAKNDKVLPLVVNSGDSGTLDDALYYSRLLVKKGNEDQYQSGTGYSIDNIAGKKMSFVSTSSTSGFKVPSSGIVEYFSQQDQWKDLKAEDLLEGGSGKFFSQVIFGGSHQLSLVNVLTDKADVAAVDDIDVASYVELTSGTANRPGAVYTVREDADAPFDKLAGAQYVIIKATPVLNAPITVNTGALSQQTIDAIKQALTSDEVTNNPKIFIPENAENKGFFNQPQRFLPVEDDWFNPIRELSK